jgi:hypothetical protein
MPVTDNNMVAQAADSPMRFSLAPELVDLKSSSREQVMDAHPVTYRVMSKELEREGKLRPFGTVDGEKTSDARNYLFVEYRAAHNGSAFTTSVNLKDGRSFASDLGRLDYSIDRDGWVRTAVELPPGTGREEIASIAFSCRVNEPAREKPWPHSGTCRLTEVSKVFFLTPEYIPGASIFSTRAPAEIPSGRGLMFPL